MHESLRLFQIVEHGDGRYDFCFLVPEYVAEVFCRKEIRNECDILGIVVTELRPRRIHADKDEARTIVQFQKRCIVTPDVEDDVTLLGIAHHHRLHMDVLKVPDHGSIDSGTVAVVHPVHLLRCAGVLELDQATDTLPRAFYKFDWHRFDVFCCIFRKDPCERLLPKCEESFQPLIAADATAVNFRVHAAEIVACDTCPCTVSPFALTPYLPGKY